MEVPFFAQQPQLGDPRQFHSMTKNLITIKVKSRTTCSLSDFFCTYQVLQNR